MIDKEDYPESLTMKTKLSLVLASLAMAFSVGAGVAATNKDISNADAADIYSTCETYYNAKDKTGLFGAVRSVAQANRISLKGGSAYGNLWEIYKTAYIKSDGYIFDYYSNISNFRPGTDQAGNYSGEGDKYNREHSIPQSWWDSGTTYQGADAYIVVPTDGWVNNKRGNLPFGNVGSVTGTSNGGFSKWGSSKSGYGYSGTVFEPDDSVKGDFARIYYYAIVGWDNSYTWTYAEGDSCFKGTYDETNHGLTDYAIKLLSEWSKLDPVSDWERSVNTKVKAAQGNVNPFIDHPEYADVIWKDATGYTKYANDTGITSISKTSATLAEGETTTISAVSSNSGTISWVSDDEDVATVSSPTAASGANVTITGVAAGTATITAIVTIDGTQYPKTCTVTVTKVVSSLSKGSTSPTKTTYTAGESFDSTGLTITATYSDSTTSNVTSSVVWTPDPLTAGTTSVTGTFGGKTITITGLTVNAATEPEIIDSNSDLSVGDYVVLRTAAGVGVTGWNNNKDATVSETETEWKKYYVASASSSGFTLKDESANNFIATPGRDNKFVYGSAATCSTDSSGHLICNSRYLCKNGTNYRFYTSVGSYLPFFIYKVPASSTKTLSSISVATAPTKVTYTAGEYFDPTGLFITRTYSDSTSDTYAYAGHTSEFAFTPTTSTALTTSNTSATITYSGKSTSQAITVNAAKTLSSISVSTAPTKTSYYSGQTFDPTGLVIRRTYSDSTYDTYTYANHTSEFSFSPSTSTALTTSNVSVTITYGGKSTTQAITVNEVTLTSIAVSTAPSKLTYVVDECFNPTGLVITRNYSNSTSDTYTYANHTSEFSFNPSLSTGLTTQNTSVTISYGGKSTTQAITVNTSGGGGSETEESSVTINFASGGNCTSTSGSFDGVSFTTAQSSSNNPPAYNTNSSELRMYYASSGDGNALTLTPDSGYSIIGVVITASSSSYTPTVKYNVDGGSDVTGSWSSTVMTISGVSASSSFVFRNANTTSTQLRIKSIDVTLESESGSSSDPTSITATVSKKFYVGETITSSDITVKDNNNKTVSSFTFADDGYKFTYADAASGGASTSKTFTDAISGANLTCSLTVQVQRKAYAAPSTSTLEHTGSEFSSAGIGSSYATNQTATVDGITFTVDGYIYSSKLSLSSSKTSAPGKVINTTPYPGGITNVTVSGASPDIQLSTDGSTWVDLSSAQTSTNNYLYLKLFYKTTSQSSYVNITSFTVTHRAAETASNVANYVMYEDTNNQCNTKLDIAIGYLNNLTQTELNSFATKTESQDYVIYTARTRLNAWAASKGKTINYSTSGHVVMGSYVNPIINAFEAGNATTIIIIIGIIGLTALGGYIFIRKRKEI